MNCERAQAAISERMDGERLPGRVAAAVDAHAVGCTSCRAFAERAAELRSAVRIRPAERIPDLMEPIMAQVARSTPPGRRFGGRPDRERWLRPIAAALLVGVVAGSVIVGGPWQSGGTRTTATAVDVGRGVRAAARHVEAYHAVFAITERGLSIDVPTRSLEAQLWFSAPGRYRLDVRDTTSYPSEAWTPTDLTYVQDGDATLRSGPSGCPSSLPPTRCPPTRTVTQERSPYAGAATSVADLVVPLDVLANPRGLAVERTGTVLGRPAVLVRMSFARAAPLFPFLQLGGTWRPFYEGDRVELWVDAADWSPLRWTVYPSQDATRAAWEMRFGRPSESPAIPILDVIATQSDHLRPTADRFALAGAAPQVPLDDLAARLGFHPVTPAATNELVLTGAAAPPTGRGSLQSVLTYSSGLTYLRVGERHRWTSPQPFGPVSADAEQVQVGEGVAYYEPAAGDLGRRLSIHTSDTNIYLETNLPRDQLLAVAASLPLTGTELPVAWRVQHGGDARTELLTLAQAKAGTSFGFDVPGTLPGGYVLASVQRAVVRGVQSVTLDLRQRDSDLGAGPIRIHLEAADALPPAASAHQITVPLGAVEARWIPAQARLEWVADGIYRSVDGPGIDLGTLAAVASSIEASA
ncbi:MAG: zf-HC2 domain-containing protein [Actinomycetota bacterium]